MPVDFKSNDLTPPSNLDDTLFDGSFSRWMPYLCYKPNEEPYLLEEVHEVIQAIEKNNPSELKEELGEYKVAD